MTARDPARIFYEPPSWFAQAEAEIDAKRRPDGSYPRSQGPMPYRTRAEATEAVQRYQLHHPSCWCLRCRPDELHPSEQTEPE